MDYKKNELHKFIGKVQCLVNDQDLEVERAVCCRGKYRFRPQYQYLEIAEEKWFNMTPEARRKHMAQVNRTVVVAASSFATVTPGESTLLPSSSTSFCSNPALSVELKSFAAAVKTPKPVLEGIWRKASELISAPQKIVPAPGCSVLAHMVESKSGQRPHLVTPGKGGKFACDSSCANYKSFGLCSHTVAVAEVNGKLSACIDCFKKQKKTPKMSALAKTGMPTGRGRKGVEPPRKRRRGISTETRVPFDPSVGENTDLPDVPQTSEVLPTQAVVLSGSSNCGNSAPQGYANCQLVTISPQHTTAICTGCKGKYVKPASAPNDLCIQHEEWHQVTYANSSTPSSVFSNSYYHCNLHCLRVNWPLFQPFQLVVLPAVAAKLKKEHWDFLRISFGYQC